MCMRAVAYAGGRVHTVQGPLFHSIQFAFKPQSGTFFGACSLGSASNHEGDRKVTLRSRKSGKQVHFLERGTKNP